MCVHTQVCVHSLAAHGLSRLCFDEAVRAAIATDVALVESLRELSQRQEGASGDAEIDVAVASAVKVAKFILFNLEHGNDQAPAAEAAAAGIDGHVMLSYCWGPEAADGSFPMQQKVVRIKDALERRGIKVWMDIADMQGSTLSGMAEAVEGAYAVCICMAREYKESDACRTEADYSFALKKKIVPMMNAANYRPDGWLGILLGSKVPDSAPLLSS